MEKVRSYLYMRVRVYTDEEGKNMSCEGCRGHIGQVGWGRVRIQNLIGSGVWVEQWAGILLWIVIFYPFMEKFLGKVKVCGKGVMNEIKPEVQIDPNYASKMMR